MCAMKKLSTHDRSLSPQIQDSSKTLAGCRFKKGTPSPNTELNCELHAEVITDFLESVFLVFKKLLTAQYRISMHPGILDGSINTNTNIVGSRGPRAETCCRLGNSLKNKCWFWFHSRLYSFLGLNYWTMFL